jgi:trk system potassium uptake protein TrkH
MKIAYKNTSLERALTGVKAVTSVMVVASFVILFGFERPLIPLSILFKVQLGMLCIFLAGKITRFLNARHKGEYLLRNWFEIPMLVLLGIIVLGSGRWFGEMEPGRVRHLAVGMYLIIEVTAKVCLASVGLAASGRNPTLTLFASFVVLIVTGAGLLMLPRASTTEPLSFVDALFTSTSATCVTGLIVKDTGSDFTLMGQIIILVLIQLGGLGIVVSGAVFALLLGQALSLRESVAMQDLLSARTLNRIGHMIVFIFVATLVFESIGALSMFHMWDDAPGWEAQGHSQWFCSIFHSISAFCNAGFSLFADSFISYNRKWQIYAVVCPLIVLGGLGFGVLYNLTNTLVDTVRRALKKRFNKQYRLSMDTPKRLRLQAKIVLWVSGVLVVFGALLIFLLECCAGPSDPGRGPDVLAALFQSVTARTAGFNTVDIAELTASSKLVLIVLMFIGGSPGSTAGGIKTVTLAVILMMVIATLRKRGEVEMFKRSIQMVIVGRAITVTLLFVVVLLSTTLILSVTENVPREEFTMLDILFEAASALGTVGLTTGVTPTLTTAGKFLIIAVMLVGRLGPLTLLAALTFNLKPARYNYPDEAIVVG